MTSTSTSNAAAILIDTALDGFEALRRLALQADAGNSGLVQLMTKSLVLLGVTIGVVEYMRRLGVDTATLEEDYLLFGPIDTPQYLYMADVTVGQLHTGISSDRLLERVRIADVVQCRF